MSLKECLAASGLPFVNSIAVDACLVSAVLQLDLALGVSSMLRSWRSRESSLRIVP